MATEKQRQALKRLAELEGDTIKPCPHCGRCVLAGPPCCEGMMRDALAAIAKLGGVK